MTHELKPCPFCGHENIAVYSKVHDFVYKDGTPMLGTFYYAECEYCGCSLGPAPTEEMLMENWNTRAEERKKGQWIDGKPYVNSHWKVCSVCHETAPYSHGGDKFCPNCGADMRGDR